jgi:hypothetical protein
LRGSIAKQFYVVNKTVTVVCTLLVAVTVARAHPEFAPSTVNRYVKFDLVAPDELRLAYTVMVGPGPAAVWRRAADANADGRISADEKRAIGERALAALRAGLSLRVDGNDLAPSFDAPEVGLAGDDVAPSPLSVDLVAHVKLAGAGPHTVRFDDATPEPQLGETEVRVEESPTTRLVASHRGPTGDEKETRILFRGQKFSALEDRSITFVFKAAPSPSATASKPAAPKRRGAGCSCSF